MSKSPAMKTYLFLIIRILFLIYLVGYFTHLDLSKVNHILRIVLIVFLTSEIFNLIKLIFRNKNLAESFKTFSISSLIIFVFLLILEVAFMFVPRTHAVGYTNASKLWSKMYWKPINSFGYRDDEIKQDTLKKTYFFVGDSFTAGFGIKNAKKRYSNLIAEKRTDINVYNLGINAIDTEKEFIYMEDFIRHSSVKPDKIFLQYYGNDIDLAAMKNNLNFKGFTPHSNVPSFLNSIVRSSYLLDYFYWLFPRNDSANYWDFLIEAYNSEKTLQDHYGDLNKFVEYANNNNAELIVILFPFIQDLAASEDLYLTKIRTFFESKDIKVLNVSPLIKDLPLSKTLVNNNDAHASKVVNKLVADEIIKMGY
jgi:lysophospholipase L1-like esterase